jgi:phage terminase large subunit GpA-like protein
LIDSGDGEKTDLVYNLCSCYGEGQIFPLKGFNASVKTSQKFKILPLENYNSALVEAYVDQYKNQLSRWLNQEWRENEDYPDGWITFANEYSDEYLRQLTTEKKVKKTTAGGLITVQWVQHGRNESFDLNVYNLCAAEIFVQTYSKNFLQLDYTDAKAVFEDLMNGE